MDKCEFQSIKMMKDISPIACKLNCTRWSHSEEAQVLCFRLLPSQNASIESKSKVFGNKAANLASKLKT